MSQPWLQGFTHNIQQLLDEAELYIVLCQWWVNQLLAEAKGQGKYLEDVAWAQII